MKVTRILQANIPPEIQAICETMGFVRADIWRRYGALGTVGKSNQDIRAEIAAAKLYSDLSVDGTIRNETTKNIIDNVLMYKAAAAAKVRQAIYLRTKDKADGKNFGAVLTEYSDKTAATNRQRNKLHALEKRHRVAGRTAKADRIKKNNLGRKKIDSRRKVAQDRLRTIAYQSAHSIVDKAAMMVSEDLTATIGKKQQWKKFNRRMSSWAKGVLAEALDSVCEQRLAKHVLVNGAYTSQMDSINRRLEGKRVGDKFYRANGDVLQADHNAASNVLHRLDDHEISRFTPYKEVRRILLARSPAQLSVNGLELGEQPRQPSADKSYAQLCAVF